MPFVCSWQENYTLPSLSSSLDLNFRFALLSFIRTVFCLVFLPTNLMAQKVLWVKHLGGKTSKAQLEGLKVNGNSQWLFLRSDQNLMEGRREFPFTDSSNTRAFSIQEGGDISLLDSIPEKFLDLLSTTSSGQKTLKSESSNGNSYLAYGRSSAMSLPGNPDWNLAYLDGNSNRLWDIQLPEGVKIRKVDMLGNGNCLLAGSFIKGNSESDIWFGIWDSKGKELMQRSFGGKTADEAFSACHDAEGKIYISGYLAPDSSFLGNTNDLSGKDKDGFIACYDMAGNEKFLYRQRGQGLCRVEHIAATPQGNILFASTFTGKDWRLSPFGFPRIGKQDIVLGSIDPRTGKEKDNALRIFPNPAREIVYFSLQKPALKGRIQASLHSKDGRILQEMQISAQTGSSYRFNVSNTTPGAYFISLKSGGKTLTERVVVE